MQKKFPMDYTIDHIQQFFRPHGNVISVRLRRTTQRHFKGSAFIEFDTIDEAKKVAAMKLELNSVPLILFMKQDYINQKKEEYKQRKDFKKMKDDPNAPDVESSMEISYTPGTILKFNGIGDGQTRETLKDIFEIFAKVEYIDFSRSLKDGHIRYTNAADCTKTCTELVKNKTPIGDKVPTLTVLTGDEEKNYWMQVTHGRTIKRTKGKFKHKTAKGKAAARTKAAKEKAKGKTKANDTSDTASEISDIVSDTASEISDINSSITNSSITNTSTSNTNNTKSTRVTKPAKEKGSTSAKKSSQN